MLLMSTGYVYGGGSMNSSNQNSRKKMLVLFLALGLLVVVAIIAVGLRSGGEERSKNKASDTANTFINYLISNKHEESYLMLDFRVTTSETKASWQEKVNKVSATITTKKPTINSEVALANEQNKSDNSGYKYTYLVDGKDGKYIIIIAVNTANKVINFTNSRYQL